LVHTELTQGVALGNGLSTYKMENSIKREKEMEYSKYGEIIMKTDEEKKAHLKEYQRQWRLKHRLTLNAYYKDYMPGYYRKKKANMTDEQREEQRDKWREYQRQHRLKKKQKLH